MCLLAACGDDSGTDDSNDGGRGGGRAGGAGTAGSNVGGAPTSSGDAGAGGTESDGGTDTGTEPTAGTTNGGAGAPSTDGGAPGTGGSGTTAGTAGNPPTAGTGGIPGTGSGGEGGTESDPTGDGGMAGSGGSGGSEDPGPVGLVARYTFDEDTGTTAADSTGNFGAATLEKATFTPGRRGTSGVELSANEAHVSFPPGFFTGVEKATIALWVNMTTTQPWSRIFDFSNAQGHFMYLASDRGGTDGPQFAIYNGSGATEAQLKVPGHLPLNVWKHLAITVDGPTYTLYVDGYPAEQVTTNPRTPADIAPTVAGWLGKSFFAADSYFKGKMDDFQVHDVVLTQAQIAQLAWPDSDYSYFRFDENAGATTAADSSDREFHGTLTGGTFANDGRVGGALHLAGANSEFVSLDPTVLSNCDDFTFALWAKLDSVGNWTRLLDLFGVPDRFLFFTPAFDDAGTQKLYFNIFAGTDSGVMGTYPSGTVLAGQWHHYAVTLQGTVARVYFDGVQIGVNQNLAFAPTDIPIGQDAHAWIGKSMFPDPYLDGAIDELRVACRAFTATEIKQLAR